MDDNGELKDLIDALSEIYSDTDDITRIVNLLDSTFPIVLSPGREANGPKTIGRWALPKHIVLPLQNSGDEYSIDVHDSKSSIHAYYAREETYKKLQTFGSSICLAHKVSSHLESENNSLLNIMLHVLKHELPGLLIIDDDQNINHFHRDLLQIILNDVCEISVLAATEKDAPILTIEELAPEFVANTKRFLNQNKHYYSRAIFVYVNSLVSDDPIPVVYLVRTNEIEQLSKENAELFDEIESGAVQHLDELLSSNFFVAAIDQDTHLATKIKAYNLHPGVAAPTARLGFDEQWVVLN